MRADVKENCERCSTSAQYANCHQPEPMLHYPIPDLLWQFVSQGILRMAHVSTLLQLTTAVTSLK